MVEIIPKKTPQTPRWLTILFYISLALLVSSIASYFILGSYLEKSKVALEDLEKSLREKETPETAALKTEILNYQRKIEDLSSIIGQHLNSSEAFILLQKISHPKVWFSQFSLNSRQGIVNVSGETESFETLGQQDLIFRKEDLIQNVDLESISINERGRVNFSFSLSFNPRIFTPYFSQ